MEKAPKEEGEGVVGFPKVAPIEKEGLKGHRSPISPCKWRW